MSLKRTAPPAYGVLPIGISEAGDHLIDLPGEDYSLVASLMSAATELVQDHTARQFRSAGWTLYADRFSPCMELRVCPVQAVVEVRYYDVDGEQQTLDEDAYLVDVASEPARLVPAPGTSWPATQRRINAVEVEFTAGYGEQPAIPTTAKQAIKLLVGHWYANRESVGQVGSEIALAYSALIWSLRWSV